MYSINYVLLILYKLLTDPPCLVFTYLWFTTFKVLFLKAKTDCVTSVWNSPMALHGCQDEIFGFTRALRNALLVSPASPTLLLHLYCLFKAYYFLKSINRLSPEVLTFLHKLLARYILPCSKPSRNWTDVLALLMHYFIWNAFPDPSHMMN